MIHLISGLPAHLLLVHALVVFVPVAALLIVLSAALAGRQAHAGHHHSDLRAGHAGDGADHHVGRPLAQVVRIGEAGSRAVWTGTQICTDPVAAGGQCTSTLGQ